jgi:hypothetical protein
MGHNHGTVCGKIRDRNMDPLFMWTAYTVETPFSVPWFDIQWYQGNNRSFKFPYCKIFLNLIVIFSDPKRNLKRGLHCNSSNSSFRFLWETVDLITKLRKIINGVEFNTKITDLGSVKHNVKWHDWHEFRLQILLLQRCGHNGAHACIVCWFFAKALMLFADNWTTFMHHPVCLQCSRKSRRPPCVKCGL